ncbi:MAG: hypothetical protein GY822_27380 [Deltaproteobacteria bacterium]|nr:hypothetical protein [Deltaproteobacteria bacterium]
MSESLLRAETKPLFAGVVLTLSVVCQAWDICRVCFWENGGDGPNHTSLAEAKENFATYRAMSKRHIKHVERDVRRKYARSEEYLKQRKRLLDALFHGVFQLLTSRKSLPFLQKGIHLRVEKSRKASPHLGNCLQKKLFSHANIGRQLRPVLLRNRTGV